MCSTKGIPQRRELKRGEKCTSALSTQQNAQQKGWETHLCLGCRNWPFWPIPCCWHHMMRFPHFPVACYMTLKFWLFTCLLIRSRSHKMTWLAPLQDCTWKELIKYSTNLSPKLILQYKFCHPIKGKDIYIYLGEKDPSHPRPWPLLGLYSVSCPNRNVCQKQDWITIPGPMHAV